MNNLEHVLFLQTPVERIDFGGQPLQFSLQCGMRYGNAGMWPHCSEIQFSFEKKRIPCFDFLGCDVESVYIYICFEIQSISIYNETSM